MQPNPPSLALRTARLEGDVHQIWEHLREHADAHQVLTTKLDDLSRDVRAVTHQVRTEVLPRLDDIDTRLDGVDARLDRLEAGQAETQRGVAALLAHFQITISE